MLLSLTLRLEKNLLERISERYDVHYDSLNFTLPPKILTIACIP